MYPGHPWQDEEFGAYEFERLLGEGSCFNLEFDLRMAGFIEFCRGRGLHPNHVIMKVLARLSAEHLPPRILSLRNRVHPARYPVGYVRPLRSDADMLEHVCVREKTGAFVERPIRTQMQPLVRWFARWPRLGLALSRGPLSYREVKDHYALLVSRNPLKNLGARYCFHAGPYRSCALNIPFGDLATVSFGAPCAFGSANFYEPFLKQFKTWMEEPDKIPAELLDKPYHEAPGQRILD